jgi:hypothetical protein
MTASHPISDVRALKHRTAQDALRNLECNGETVMLIFAGRGATRYDRCPKAFFSAVALAATVIFWL